MELFYCNVFFSQLVSHNQELMRANLNSQEINEVCVCVRACVCVCIWCVHVHVYTQYIAVLLHSLEIFTCT